MNEYTSERGNLVMDLGYGSVGGVRVNISRWRNDDWVTVYNRLIFGDCVAECVSGALCEVGFDWETAEEQTELWGFEYPNDEED